MTIDPSKGGIQAASRSAEHEENYLSNRIRSRNLDSPGACRNARGTSRRRWAHGTWPWLWRHGTRRPKVRRVRARLACHGGGYGGGYGYSGGCWGSNGAWMPWAVGGDLLGGAIAAGSQCPYGYY
jgi:hypothetical protein